MKSTWQKGYGAWVTTVLTTRKGLPLNIAAVLPVATIVQLRDAASTDGVNGLGERPRIATFSLTTGPKLEVALSGDDQLAGLKPWQAQAEELARTI